MSSTELRMEVNSFLDQVDDHFLKVVHAMLKTYVREQNVSDGSDIIGSKPDGSPFTQNELKWIKKWVRIRYAL